MKKRLVKLPYPFAWLDEAIEQTLNPVKGSVTLLAADEIEQLRFKFGTEVHEVLGSLKAQTFWIISPKKKKAVLEEYVKAIRLLKKQAAFNQDNYPQGSILQIAGNAIIAYLDELSHAIEKRYPAYLPAQRTADENAPQPAPGIFKIICDLSIDQMGIILKAADDIKLIVSRSLSQVFKSIVPYLSTTNKAELSWDSMRSNSYHPEERDKDAAIAALEKLIRKIRDL